MQSFDSTIRGVEGQGELIRVRAVKPDCGQASGVKLNLENVLTTLWCLTANGAKGTSVSDVVGQYNAQVLHVNEATVTAERGSKTTDDRARWRAGLFRRQAEGKGW